MEQIFIAIPIVVNDLGPNAETAKALVFAAWSRCAGEMLRMRTAPLEFNDNRLVIAVQDETWRRHLEYLSPQMLFKINGSIRAGTVKFIEFRIDAASVNIIQEGKKIDKEIGRKDEITASLKEAAKAITDKNLREQFLDTAAVYLSKNHRS